MNSLFFPWIKFFSQITTHKSIPLGLQRNFLENSISIIQKKKLPGYLREGHFAGMRADYHFPTYHGINRKTLLYAHGGGFSLLSSKTHRQLISSISESAGVNAIAVDYPLAPEHPFPRAIEKLLNAYKDLLKQFPAESILLGGDSAGAGLVLSLQLMIEREKLPSPSGIILLSPWIDLTCTGKSIKQNSNRDMMLTWSQLRRYRRKYCPPELYSNPLVSPLYGNFKKIPPVLIQVGDSEILLDDARRLEEALSHKGFQAKLQIWPKTFHVWQFYGNEMKQSKQAIDEITSFIKSI